MSLANDHTRDSAGADGAALSILVETVEALAGVRTVEEVASVVRSSARRMSGADGVAFVLRDGDQCHYLDEDAIAPLWKGLRFPMTHCVSGWAMMNRATAAISDIYADERVPHDAYRPTFVKSMVMTPVRQADPLGAIGAYWAEPRSWSPTELVQLETMARATATALESARLYASLDEALQRRDLLIRELDHRVKNTLAAVQAIAIQTQRLAASPQDFTRGFEERLQALARAHELLTRGAWAPASLRDLLEGALAPFRPEGPDRLVIEGPPVLLAAESAVTLHMIFHELATNAAKHGALSDGRGGVAVRWTADKGEGLRLTWREHGGPPVRKPQRRGFGSRLIERGLAADLKGTGALSFEPEGLRFDMTAPLDGRVALG